MNVVTLVDFYDRLRGVQRRKGEEFTVSRERFDEINDIGMDRIGRPLVAMSVAEKITPEKKVAKPRRRKASK